MMSVASSMMIVVSIASTMMIVVTMASTMMIVVTISMVVVVMALVLTVLHWNLLNHDPWLLDRNGLTMLSWDLPAFLQRNRDWTLNWNILTVGLRNVKTFLNQYNVKIDCVFIY